MSVSAEQATGWDEQYRKTVFATVAKDVKSQVDQDLFEQVCLSSGLDPLRKEIYAVSRYSKGGSVMSIQTGIDGYLKLANSTKELNGMEVIYYDKDGNSSEVWLDEKAPAACLVRVYRKGAQFPFTASCRYEAYVQKGRDGHPNAMWKKFPETMLAKATTTLALRRGFADVIGGIASADEMAQADLAAPEALLQGTPAAEVKVPPAPLGKVVEVVPAPEKPVTKKTAKAKAKPEPEAAPAEEPKTSSKLDDLFKLLANKGLSELGWQALQKQFNGKLEAKASAVAAGMDEAKIANLNAGKDSLGKNQLIEAPVTVPADEDALGDW